MKRVLVALPFVVSAAVGATAGWAMCRFRWFVDGPASGCKA